MSRKSGVCTSMDARLYRLTLACLLILVASGASYPTPNFVIHCQDPQLAQELGEAAEKYRKELANLWLGKTLPNWSRPCPVKVRVGPNLGAGGSTTFVFDRGEVYGWDMTIQGSRERLLDSVLPHEITHMILASHFRRPVPRWADEGAATSVEHISEREKHRRMLLEFLRTRRGIPFRHMFAMEEYPRDILPLYAQGFALSDFLIQQGGHQRFVKFLEDGLKDSNWDAALSRWYGVSDLGQLQLSWLAWVERGFPQLAPQPETPPGQSAPLLASAETSTWRPRQSANSPAPSLYQQAIALTPPTQSVVLAGGASPAASSASAGLDQSPSGNAIPADPPLVDVTGWRPAQPSVGIFHQAASQPSPENVALAVDRNPADPPQEALANVATPWQGSRISQMNTTADAAQTPATSESDRVLLDWTRPTAWR